MTIKKSILEEFTKGSRERSIRRSKNKSKPKWKNSPYKKKLAAKLHKLKTVINDTPERYRQSAGGRRNKISINEYSSFIHGTKKSKHNSKLSSANRKHSRDSGKLKTNRLTYLVIASKFNIMTVGSSRNRNRSKTKSDKFTFLTINNFK